MWDRCTFFHFVLVCGCIGIAGSARVSCRDRILNPSVLTFSNPNCTDIGRSQVSCGNLSALARTNYTNGWLYRLPTGWTLWYFSIGISPCKNYNNFGKFNAQASLEITMVWSRGVYIDDVGNVVNTEAQETFSAEYPVFSAASLTQVDAQTQTWIKLENFAVEKGCTCNGEQCPVCLCNPCLCDGTTAFEISRKQLCSATRPSEATVTAEYSKDDQGRSLYYYDEYVSGDVTLLVGSRNPSAVCGECRLNPLYIFCLGANGTALPTICRTQSFSASRAAPSPRHPVRGQPAARGAAVAAAAGLLAVAWWRRAAAADYA